ncbi:MAG TPA: FTR1 family protein [Thermomicrobiales bacterium]|nr:FTR1 family protein [Thermomicrobiales bacterium]
MSDRGIEVENAWSAVPKAALATIALCVLAVLVWQGITADGAPDPMTPGLHHRAVVIDAGVLVFREGLEAILVLAAITSSFVGARARFRAPIGLGAGAAGLASIATWFIVIGIIGAINAPALHVQAATGLLAVLVLLVIMNWFFHRIYWTGWIAHHNRRRRDIMAVGGSSVTLGLILLGFTAVYREGFEIVLFLQTLRLQAGSGTVLEGVAIGLALTAAVGVLTFMANRKLPYKRMLVLTGIMLGFVLVVMVGESVQEMQLAGWVPTTEVNLPIPDWMGVWFATFPTVETLLGQLLAAVLVIGSYFVARETRLVRAPGSPSGAGRAD